MTSTFTIITNHHLSFFNTFLSMLQLPFLLLDLLVLVLFQFYNGYVCNGQQQYKGNTTLDCYNETYNGYVCNGPQNTCQSYLTFLSRPPYDSPLAIANLMASEASAIVSINQIVSESHTFEPETLVKVPVSCSCWGNNYLHNAQYMVRESQTYYLISRETYQGLSACESLIGTNNFYIEGPEKIPVGSQIMVPLNCACPSHEQGASGVGSLLVYVVKLGDSLSSIAERFGASLSSVLSANNVTESDVIYPLTPLLVPLRNSSCSGGPGGQRSFLCKPSTPAASVKLVTILGICIGIGFVCSFFICYGLYQYIKKRRHKVRKQKFFMQNGGKMLHNRLASSGSSETLKLFTSEELEKATDNYSRSRFLGQGGYGEVYKGMLLDGTIVAVKRSKMIDKNRTEQFINEIVVLSQINHRNVVKLLGSCLETEFPLLVYEFIPNGSLSDHIHCQGTGYSHLSWNVRFRIACEVAGAVAYMHSAASIPIFHRDIKTSNILLDDKYIAKVSDFGTSRVVSSDKTHLTTAVQGTFGYLDPEYFQSSKFTDKSDVYSFGVVLVELLTGQKPSSLVIGNEDKYIVSHFISLTREDRLQELLDPQIAKEVSTREVVAIGKLVKRCLRLNGKKRPSMKEVAMELENLIKSQTCIDICQGNEVLFREGESVLDSEDGNDEMRPTFEEESIANVSLSMYSIHPRD